LIRLDMAFKYTEAVPWGRSFDEYRRMFHLTEDDFRRSILGCADGPASFNREMFRNGHRVVSCDPLYQFTGREIEQRVEATYNDILEQSMRNQDQFVWDLIESPEQLGRIRLAAMRDFLADYEAGKSDGRYVPAQLPDLPFADRSFDIALCGHFLFFYSDSLSITFHQRSVDELCRIAREIRIFPLLTYNADPCPLVDLIVEHVRKSGLTASVENVPYEFQKGGNRMLRISRAASRAA
jgi:hypothetical protein